MTRFSVNSFACLMLLGLASLVQAQNEIVKPSVIGTTFTVTVPYLGAETVNLQEDNGNLTVHTRWQQNGREDSHSVRYATINFVKVEAWPLLNKEAKPVIIIEDLDGSHFEATLRTDTEAKELAAYVVHKSSAKLEFIGNAWRIRKPFTCPEGSQPGCQDFKELLDHDDAEIAKYYYYRDRTLRTYACFSDTERQFFVVEVFGTGNEVIGGNLLRHVFKNGQPDGFSFDAIDWVGKGTAGTTFEGAGTIIAVDNMGRRLQRIGSLDLSSLHLQQKYANRMNSTTQYTLNIRWSTGRYTESFSSKDYTGRPVDLDTSGICIKLN